MVFGAGKHLIKPSPLPRHHSVSEPSPNKNAIQATSIISKCLFLYAISYQSECDEMLDHLTVSLSTQPLRATYVGIYYIRLDPSSLCNVR